MSTEHQEQDARLAANLTLLQAAYTTSTPWSPDEAQRLADRIKIVLKDDGAHTLVDAGSVELVWGEP
jgi:hypothetical protein